MEGKPAQGCTSACTGVAAGPQPGSCVPQKKEDKYIHHLQNRQLIRHNSCLFLPSLFYTVAGELFQNFCQIKSDPPSLNPPINSSALRIKSKPYSLIWLLHSFLIPSPMLPPAHVLLSVSCARTSSPGISSPLVPCHSISTFVQRPPCYPI